MSPGARCDEILRMIDEVLAEAAPSEPAASDDFRDDAAGDAHDGLLAGAADRRVTPPRAA